MVVEKIYKDTEKKMQNSIEAYKKQLNTVRTGRASTSILEGVVVNSYGSPTPLSHIATLSTPESRLITVQPWDRGLLGEIEKAILKADLGLTPANDGKIIRIPVPPLTEERRKELVKVVKKMGEERKVAVRNIRREKNEELKSLEKEKEITEDELYKTQENIQKITDKFIELVDELGERKSKEILEL
ncbi:MAG: ribosome recycling factor [Nitrospinae bacterium RIFCSPLOWO2_12_FULL_45_22]|nr:MAG: ribosome recycling factor [Nitrospinae bacterium RIFCSPLOWO2_12_FULL_45_22]